MPDDGPYFETLLLRIIHAIVWDNRDYVGQYQAPERRVIKKAA